MGIHNTHMYEKAIVAMAKQSVTLEVLSYHASASMDDAVRLRVCSFLLPFFSVSIHSKAKYFYLFVQCVFFLFRSTANESAIGDLLPVA